MLPRCKLSRSIIFLLVFNIYTGYGQKTFQVPFQTKYNGSSPPSINEWIELDSNNITSVREFTVCNGFGKGTSINEFHCNCGRTVHSILKIQKWNVWQHIWKVPLNPCIGMSSFILIYDLTIQFYIRHTIFISFITGNGCIFA